MTDKVKKVLGGTKYKGSKKKTKDLKSIKDKIATTKNRSIKVKIKHLEKEEKRIDNSIEKKSGEKKIIIQQAALREKINKLKELLKKYTADLKN